MACYHWTVFGHWNFNFNKYHRALGISLISQRYVNLLGLIPIYLGVREYISNKREKLEQGENVEDSENGEKNESLQCHETSKKGLIEKINAEEGTDIKENFVITFLKGFIILNILR